MVLRWAAAAFLLTEKSFRKVQGYRDLWEHVEKVAFAVILSEAKNLCWQKYEERGDSSRVPRAQNDSWRHFSTSY